MKKIKLTWSGATDDIGIVGYEIFYKLSPYIGNWIKVAFVGVTPSTIGDTHNYEFTVTNFVEHKFIIRSVDTSGQFSSFTSDLIVTPPSFLSYRSTNSSVLSTCSNGDPTNVPIIIKNNNDPISSGNTIVNGLVVFDTQDIEFNGNNRRWAISHNNIRYSCKIDSLGVITVSEDCSFSPVVTQVTLSTPSNTTTLSCNRPSEYIRYISGNTLTNNTTIVYVNIQNGVLSSPVEGNNKYYLLRIGNISYIVKIDNNGLIKEINQYDAVCPSTPPTGGGGGGGGGGEGLVRSLTSSE